MSSTSMLLVALTVAPRSGDRGKRQEARGHQGLYYFRGWVMYIYKQTRKLSDPLPPVLAHEASFLSGWR
jgi:hypothetical protein